MNRYDIGSVSNFSPLSFNELAAAPTMMRQKHDNSIAQAEAMRIQADPLKEHYARALELKQQMDNEIAKNVDTLNKEGYNPTTFQNITKLNRQYQDLISPTGEVGIINAAKIAEAKAKEDFMKNADKSFGQNVLEQRWLEHRQKYADINGRDKDGKIINIDNLGSPKYVDLDTGIRDVLSTLGSTTREKLLNSGLHFQNTDFGPVMVNAQGSVVTKTNDEQLDNALNALKTRFINKTGEGRISRDFEGRTSDEDLAYINSRISAANVYDQRKDYKTNYDMISTGGGPGDKNGTSATPLISVQNSIESKEFANQKYSDNLSAYKQLRSIPEKNMSEEQKVKMNMLETLIKGVDGDLVRTKAYINNKPIVDRFEKSIPKEYLNIVQNANHMSASEYDKEISKIAEQEFKKSSPGSRFIETRRGSTHINVRNKVDELVNKRRELYKPITDAKNTLTNLNNKKFYHYSLAPISEKEQGQYKNLSNALEGVVKDSGPSGLRNLGLIESVDMGDGSKRYKLTSNDRDQIQSLITNSEPGSVRLVSVSEKGPSGKPQLRIAFKVGKKSTDKDLSGWSLNPFNKSSDNLPEEGEEAFINVAFNSLNNIKDGGPGVKKITGLITNYLSERGEVTEEGSTEGYDLAKAIINNAYNVNN